MKKLILGVTLACVLAVMVFAADPQYGGYHKQPADKTVSSAQWTASTWQIIDSLAYTLTDTGRVFISIEGMVELDPGEGLYISACDDSLANQTVPQKDTIIILAENTGLQKRSVYFRQTYVDSVVSQTDLVDTIWFLGATKGSNQTVEIKNVTIQGRIADKNPS